MSRVAVVYTTFPDEETAEAAVRELLERRLVACGNVFGVRSLYHWKGAVEDVREAAVLLKVPAAGLTRLFAAVKALHPYDVPCIEEWDVDRVHAPYASWVKAETRAARPRAAKGSAARRAGAAPKRASAASSQGRGSKGRGSRSRTRAT